MRNKVFIVLDSLRWDIFKKARAPFLKGLGQWKKAYTQGTYTLPAHMAFFAGKLPQTLDNTNFYENEPMRINREGGLQKNLQLWRLVNLESPRPAREALEGMNIIDGYRKLGYITIGTGAVSWFNPTVPSGKYLTEPFEEFKFFDGPDKIPHSVAEEQIDWALDTVNKHKDRPYFLFINMGETHAIFLYKNCPWPLDEVPYGNAKECKKRQRLCLEYLDGQIEGLLAGLMNYDLVITSDHGDAFGENGLWGHCFCHPKVMEVPLMIKL